MAIQKSYETPSWASRRSPLRDEDRTMSVANETPAWFDGEESRAVVEALRSCLSKVTEISDRSTRSPSEIWTSPPDIEVDCGFCSYDSKNDTWIVLFNPSVDLALMSSQGDCFDSVLVRATTPLAVQRPFSVATLRRKDGPESGIDVERPPVKLVQFILKCAELTNMFLQAHENLCKGRGNVVSCLTRNDRSEIDLNPVLRNFRIEGMANAVEMAMRCSSPALVVPRVLSNTYASWTVDMSSKSRAPKGLKRNSAFVSAIENLVDSCLGWNHSTENENRLISPPSLAASSESCSSSLHASRCDEVIIPRTNKSAHATLDVRDEIRSDSMSPYKADDDVTTFDDSNDDNNVVDTVVTVEEANLNETVELNANTSPKHGEENHDTAGVEGVGSVQDKPCLTHTKRNAYGRRNRQRNGLPAVAKPYGRKATTLAMKMANRPPDHEETEPIIDGPGSEGSTEGHVAFEAQATASAQAADNEEQPVSAVPPMGIMVDTENVEMEEEIETRGVTGPQRPTRSSQAAQTQVPSNRDGIGSTSVDADHQTRMRLDLRDAASESERKPIEGDQAESVEISVKSPKPSRSLRPRRREPGALQGLNSPAAVPSSEASSANLPVSAEAVEPDSSPSRIPGVTWDMEKQKWHVKLTYEKRSRHIGRFITKEKAICALNVAKKLLPNDAPLGNATGKSNKEILDAVVFARETAREAAEKITHESDSILPKSNDGCEQITVDVERNAQPPDILKPASKAVDETEEKRAVETVAELDEAKEEAESHESGSNSGFEARVIGAVSVAQTTNPLKADLKTVERSAEQERVEAIQDEGSAGPSADQLRRTRAFMTRNTSSELLKGQCDQTMSQVCSGNGNSDGEINGVLASYRRKLRCKDTRASSKVLKNGATKPSKERRSEKGKKSAPLKNGTQQEETCEKASGKRGIEDAENDGKQVVSRPPYRGYSKIKNKNQWQTYFHYGGKMRAIGYFDSEKKASCASNAAREFLRRRPLSGRQKEEAIVAATKKAARDAVRKMVDEAEYDTPINGMVCKNTTSAETKTRRQHKRALSKDRPYGREPPSVTFPSTAGMRYKDDSPVQPIASQPSKARKKKRQDSSTSAPETNDKTRNFEFRAKSNADEQITNESASQNVKSRQKKRNRELAALQESAGSVSKKRIVQLFASDFNGTLQLGENGRSKRKIKSVVRFDATPLPLAQKKLLAAASRKTGVGFSCPRCSVVCLYSEHECPACHLPCRYVPGTGVVVLRERDESVNASAVSGLLDNGAAPDLERARELLSRAQQHARRRGIILESSSLNEIPAPSPTPPQTIEPRNDEITGTFKEVENEDEMMLKMPSIPATARRPQKDYKGTAKKRSRPAKAAFHQSSDDAPPASQAEQDAPPQDEEATPQRNQTWTKLDHTHILSRFKSKSSMQIDFGNSASSALEAVESKLAEMEKDLARDADDEEYDLEMKLYNKGVKDRKWKADAERIEKVKYKEECERVRLELEYANRNRKKSQHEIEYESLLSRPIIFESRRNKKIMHPNGCKLGRDCELCTPGFNGQEESSAPNGNFLTPSFHWLSDDEIMAEDDDSSSNRRPSRNANTTKKTVGMLRKMKHDLIFVIAYNKAPLKREKEARRGTR